MARRTNTQTDTDNSQEATVSTETTEATVDNNSEQTEKFVVPTNADDLNLGDDMASLAGKRYLLLVRELAEIDGALKSQDDESSDAAVIMYAESDAASESIRQILSAYREIEKNLAEALSQLTGAVREEKGDVTLSEEDIANLKTKREVTVKMTKTARTFLEDMTANNSLPDVKAFLDAVTIPGARKGGTRSAGSGTYQSTTSVRPRIGTAGYIEVDGNKFKKFTDVVRHFKSAGKPITTGEVHQAWATASGKDISEWQSFPTDTEFELNDLTVKIHFVPDSTE